MNTPTAAAIITTTIASPAITAAAARDAAAALGVEVQVGPRNFDEESRLVEFDLQQLCTDGARREGAAAERAEPIKTVFPPRRRRSLAWGV